jgi:hypothetical protein
MRNIGRVSACIAGKGPSYNAPRGEDFRKAQGRAPRSTTELRRMNFDAYPYCAVSASHAKKRRPRHVKEEG